MEIILGVITGWLLAVGINYFSDVLPVSRSLVGVPCHQCQGAILWRRYLLRGVCSKTHTPGLDGAVFIYRHGVGGMAISTRPFGGVGRQRFTGLFRSSGGD
jgi:hypothetical protein